MTNMLRKSSKASFLAVMLLFAVYTSEESVAQGAGMDGGTHKWEDDIAAFEKADATNLPPQGAVLVTGSSTIRGWHEWIAADLAPLTVVARGFGGSTMEDLLFFFDRVVLKYKPRAVVVYEGDNDIAYGLAPEAVRDEVRRFVELVHTNLPGTRVYFISIKPSPSRMVFWPAMQEANRLVHDDCAAGSNLFYVDITKDMLAADGKPRTDIFLKDNLHMNRKGYELWKDQVRPVLIDKELQFEKVLRPGQP